MAIIVISPRTAGPIYTIDTGYNLAVQVRVVKVDARIQNGDSNHRIPPLNIPGLGSINICPRVTSASIMQSPLFTKTRVTGYPQGLKVAIPLSSFYIRFALYASTFSRSVPAGTSTTCHSIPGISYRTRPPNSL